MPRAPKPAAAAAAIPGSVFSPLAARLGELGQTLYPLHVGDTWLEPFPGGRPEDLASEALPGLHRYGPTRGIPPLLDALLAKLRERNGLVCETDSLLVASGATGGLACAVGALADPGDEVLILAPFWPLIRGIVQAFRARPVEVPFYDRVDSAEAAVAAVEARLSERSVALYVSTPSNPTGRVLPGPWLEALADLARRHDLWLLSDEVYEDIVYRGEHVSLGRFAPERCISAFSFSKGYGMAGHRVGYLAGPPELVAQAEKIGVHTAYHASIAAQQLALRALEAGADWQRRARQAYQAAGEDAARVLGLPPPEGSTFLFVKVSERLGPGGLGAFLEDCLEDGVLVAPGDASGRDYGDWIRLCYTSAPPEQVARAVRLLARRLGRPA